MLYNINTDDSEGKISEHYNWLKQVFHHPNYIKVNGSPVLMIYQKKPSRFPVLRKMRELAKADGFPGIYITCGLTKPHEDLLDIGDKKKYTPQPQRMHVALSKNIFDKVLSYPNPASWNVNRTLEIPNWCVGDMKKTRRHKRPPDIAGIISSFDNTPRRNFEEANVWSFGPPKVFIEMLRKSLHSALYYESCCFLGDHSAASYFLPSLISDQNTTFIHKEYARTLQGIN